jgi:hypothetical protein
MVAFLAAQSATLNQVRLSAGSRTFEPKGVVRCSGTPLFRSQAARDYACLLDLDRNVASWQCLPILLQDCGEWHVPDFRIARPGRIALADVTPVPDWVPLSSYNAGFHHEYIDPREERLRIRLQNSKDLLRYAQFPVHLGDRVNLLALCEEHGPLPLASCLQIVQYARDRMAVIGSLVLDRILEMDLDDAPIGPETRVYRALS